MFILTDGKSYVMENPMKIGEYISSTSINHAKKFTYKQARILIQRKGKKYSWIKKYYLVDDETGEKSDKSLYYKGNKDVYTDTNIPIDDKILDQILNETDSILGLAGWNIQQLSTYKNQLSIMLSECDSGESDVKHALERYKEIHNGKKPQAHKVAKLGYLLDDLRDRHKRIKQCIRYIEVMQDAINNSYTIERLKLELSKVKSREYNGRTKYWQLAQEILED